MLTFPAYDFYIHQLGIPSTIKSGLHCMVVALCRGCAVAVAAFEDRIAIFPTSIAAGNNVVDKVPLISSLSPCCEKQQNVFSCYCNAPVLLLRYLSTVRLKRSFE
jgi:hypothetical protein